MGKDIRSPHDEFFKNIMGRVEIARTYIAHYLPADITSRMDLDTLEVDIEGYVDDDLKQYFSDVVATVQLTDGQPSDIYILFEHKSGLGKTTRLQILKYMVLKWLKWSKDPDRFEGYLPIIMAVMVYHGTVKWRYSTAFSDLFRLPSEDFRPFIPSFEYILHDISHVDEQSFKASVDIQIFLMMLKYIFSPELNHKLPEILSLLNDLSDKDRITEYLQIILKYVLTATKLDRGRIREAVRDIPKGVETMETTASILRQEGFDEGVLIGESRGIKIGESIGESRGELRGESRGESRGIQIMLEELLQERFGVIHPMIAEKIKSVKNKDTLKGLFRQALKVESMQEFNRILDTVLQPL